MPAASVAKPAEGDGGADGEPALRGDVPAARGSGRARSRDGGAEQVAELPLEIAEVRRRVHLRAGGALEQLLRRERAAVPVHVLAEPVAERHELAALELLVEVAEIRLGALPELHETTLPSAYVGK